LEKQQKALSEIPLELRKHPIYEIPLVPFSVTGIDALRKFFVKSTVSSNIQTKKVKEDYPKLSDLINDLDIRDVKIIFTMGKGGVGKTTIASAIAVGLIEKGKRVHLTTTDPAAHLDNIFKENDLINLTVSRIDPKIEVEKYRQEVLSKVSSDIDEQAIAYLKEDLESPCTEEIAIFRAFADVVARSKEEVVVIDTAPTGHTLLLLDAAHSFHKELERSTGEIPKNVKDLLPRLRNSGETEVVIVTLPEPTPVLEARRLQEDLLRAQINPGWWIINQSFYATPTKNPILNGRTTSEKEWIRVVQDDLADKFAVIPWLMEDNINYIQLKKLQG
jgi:arsenite-transporting ATPase